MRKPCAFRAVFAMGRGGIEVEEKLTITTNQLVIGSAGDGSPGEKPRRRRRRSRSQRALQSLRVPAIVGSIVLVGAVALLIAHNLSDRAHGTRDGDRRRVE